MPQNHSNRSALLFDLDGTLVDTACEFYSAVNFLREYTGKAALDHQAIKAEVSNGARAMTRLATELEFDHPEFEQYKNLLLEHYKKKLGHAATVFQGLELCIEFCEQHEVPWGIVTNKPETFAKPLIEALNLNPDCLICPDHVKISKPDPEGLLKAAEICGAASQDCYYFGDHKRDIEAGHNANMTTIACGWGYGNNYKDWQADIICETTDDALQLIKTIYNAGL